MDTRDEYRQRFQREQEAKKRLRLATTRLHEAEHERIWAIVAARDACLSIRDAQDEHVSAVSSKLDASADLLAPLLLEGHV
jgi:hypothetical protein